MRRYLRINRFRCLFYISRYCKSSYRRYLFTIKFRNSISASQNSLSDAPPPPERGSSYAVMSQQSALRSNGSSTSNLPPSSQPASMKRVSFHDSNANSESMLRSVSSGTSNPPSMSMDTIREDPNVSCFPSHFFSYV